MRLTTLVISLLFITQATSQEIVKEYHGYTKTKIKLLGQKNSDGKKTGIWKRYTKDGRLKGVDTYNDGKRTTSLMIHYDGAYQISEYKDGVLKLIKAYTKDSTLISAGQYTDSRTMIKDEQFYSKGNLKRVRNYTNNELDGIELAYFESGKLMGKITHINGKRHGTALKNYPDGSTVTSAYNHGKLEGKKEYTNAQGIITSTEIYENDLKNGKWTSFTEDGKTLLELQNYVKDTLHGVQKTFWSSGILSMTSTYEKGVLLSYERYWQNGQLYEKATLINGLKDGVIDGYYETGELRERRIYVKGKKNGTWLYYTPAGNVYKKEVYEMDELMPQTN